jgi:hypothetical protein
LPALGVTPVVTGSFALIVGNGPTNQRCPWPAIKNGLEKSGQHVTSLWLINGTALGRTIPDFAVAVDVDIVASFLRNGLHEVAQVVTNHPDKICGPERWSATTRDVAEHDPGLSWGPASWPALASGPLCVWAAATLGFETIAIYGLDGTLSPAEEDFLMHARVWESWLLRWREARERAGEGAHFARKRAQRLLRLWPQGMGVSLENDPLQECLAESLAVAPS